MPMSRVSDSQSPSQQPAGRVEPARPSGERPAARTSGRDAGGFDGRYVCPFCGAVRDTSEGACQRCTMEDSPSTRQATKARIGPWYVLQNRNPAAPGMKYATMLALINKGQITP